LPIVGRSIHRHDGNNILHMLCACLMSSWLYVDYSGRLDQCCAYGNTIVSVIFDGPRLITEEVKARDKLFLVVVDLHSNPHSHPTHHKTQDSTLACLFVWLDVIIIEGKDTKRILRDLNSAYPFAKNELHRGVHHLFGDFNQSIVDEASAILKGVSYHPPVPLTPPLLASPQPVMTSPPGPALTPSPGDLDERPFSKMVLPSSAKEAASTLATAETKAMTTASSSDKEAVVASLNTSALPIAPDAKDVTSAERLTTGYKIGSLMKKYQVNCTMCLFVGYNPLVMFGLLLLCVSTLSLSI
jgi:hypothetical protein